jgi:nitrogen fixation/metabolism regulation signal transduction histidine kinase
VKSLRSRMVLGFALVAIVPLALALALTGRHVQRTVRADAEVRLGAALGVIQAQLSADAERLRARLDVLAADPQLKRLYLVEPAPGLALREQLASERFLLGLDELWVSDLSGRVVADGGGALAGAAGDRGVPAPRVVAAPGGAALALEAGALIHYRGEVVGAVRAGVALDSALLVRLGRTSGVHLALYDAAGRLVAQPPAAANRAQRVVIGGRSYLAASVPLAIGGAPHARIAALVSTATADETIAAFGLTAALLGVLALGVAIALGLLWSAQLSRPVERLAAFSQRIARGEWDEPLALESVRELQMLVAALERMRSDLHAYRDRLTASERQAAYGEMARKVAHEIKNPLTPIAISVADLRRSYEQRRPDFPQILDQAVRTIGEEVQTLKRLLQEFSDFGRFPAPQLAPCDVGEVLDGLRALYGHEIAAGRLAIGDPPGACVIAADRAQLKQALVNLVQNGLEAADGGGRVSLAALASAGALELVVSDDGPGLTPEQRARLFVPGFTTKTHGSGLGLTIVERIVSEHGGTIAVESGVGRGVTFRIRLPLSPES